MLFIQGNFTGLKTKAMKKQIEEVKDHRGNVIFKRLEVNEPDFMYKPLPWQLQGLMYTASGYGSKIPTIKMIKYNNRMYRVYCHIYSNAGTCYVIIKGEKVIID